MYFKYGSLTPPRLVSRVVPLDVPDRPEDVGGKIREAFGATICRVLKQSLNAISKI